MTREKQLHQPTSLLTKFKERKLAWGSAGLAVIGIALWGVLALFGSRDLLPLRVELGSRSVSKLPFVVALDQGLYEKYGLDIELWMPEPDFDAGINTLTRWSYRQFERFAIKSWEPEVIVRGGNSHIYRTATSSKKTDEIFLAATDCIVRAHVVAADGIERLEDLKGKRIGVSNISSNTGFAALLVADRMGWDPVQDISILRGGDSLDAALEQRVDAVIGHERLLAEARQKGLKVLASLSEWGEFPIAGNSVRVKREWLDDPRNREAARRFLQATIEGIAIFHQNRELVLEVIETWHGVTDTAYAETVYEEGRWIPRKPYPCYEGIRRSMARYDSREMRRFMPADFYDDSLLRELDDEGFIDGLYSQ